MTNDGARLSMGVFSTELCGGTHTPVRRSDIGLARIISESGTTAGIRCRIEAVTGEGAMATVHAQSNRLNDIAHIC